MLAITQLLPSHGLKALKLLPKGPRHFILEQITCQALSVAITEGDLEFLQDKWLALSVTDHDCCFYFTFADNRIKVADTAGPAGEPVGEPVREPDVTFAGDLQSLLQMASKMVDPDTLFFQRKLTISGDTELGLEIKNLIDNLELDNLPPWLNHPMQLYRYALSKTEMKGQAA